MWLRQSTRIILEEKYYCAKFHPDPIWNNGAFRFFKEGRPRIGVGAQSTVGGGTTFLPEKYVWKINEMPEFYMILARKIIKIR